jgi:hypothetical protein
MFFPGDEFADKTDRVYFAVNEDRGSWRSNRRDARVSRR